MFCVKYDATTYAVLVQIRGQFGGLVMFVENLLLAERLRTETYAEGKFNMY